MRDEAHARFYDVTCALGWLAHGDRSKMSPGLVGEVAAALAKVFEKHLELADRVAELYECDGSDEEGLERLDEDACEAIDALGDLAPAWATLAKLRAKR